MRRQLRRTGNQKNQNPDHARAHRPVTDVVQRGEGGGGTAQADESVKELIGERTGLSQKRNVWQNLSKDSKEDHDGEQDEEQVAGRHGEKAEIAEKNPGEKRRDIIHFCF